VVVPQRRLASDRNDRLGTSTALLLTGSYQSIKSVRDFEKMLDAPSVGLLDELHNAPRLCKQDPPGVLNSRDDPVLFQEVLSDTDQ
jgi:predicted alpha/beta-fold hydrolase